jgi:hypothetical protein
VIGRHELRLERVRHDGTADVFAVTAIPANAGTTVGSKDPKISIPLAGLGRMLQYGWKNAYNST